MTAYYNEHDPYAAQWLRNLIAAGHIAPGDVDERDIRDIKPEELKKYTQCHFFAGIGVWSLALRQAGWPDDQPVWTGSCPCQPFSAAGRKDGFTDERHLWPHWFHLITQREPSRIFGEQVASKDGLGWLDLVQTDLEGAGYANGAVDLCAAGVGAPHIRQRSWFVAERLGDANNQGLEKHGRSDELHQRPERQGTAGSDIDAGIRSRLANPDAHGRIESLQPLSPDTTERSRGSGISSGLGNTEHNGQYGRPQPRSHEAASDGRAQGSDISMQSEGTGRPRDGENLSGSGGGDKRSGVRCESVQPGPVNGFWRDADWLFCRDGKWRVVRSGTFPLVDGPPSRVGRLRAYGNAVNAKAAQAVIEAYLTD